MVLVANSKEVHQRQTVDQDKDFHLSSRMAALMAVNNKLDQTMEDPEMDDKELDLRKMDLEVVNKGMAPREMDPMEENRTKALKEMVL